MIEHIIDTGTTGQLKIVDNTDDPGLMTVGMFAKSSDPIAIPDLPWTYSIDGVMETWKTFDFQNVTEWQLLAGVDGSNASDFTLHLGDTLTTELNGPTDLEVALYDATPKVDVVVDGAYVKAVPYVRDGGIWKVVRPFVRTANGWKEL